MSKVRWLIASAILFSVVPAFGQEVTLAWKFKEGQTFYQTMTTDTTQTMKVMGSPINQKQSQTFVFSWTVDKKEGDNWVLKQKIESVKMTLDVGGQPISYDSTKEGQTSSNLGEFFKALVGGEFKLTLDKNLQVVKIDGRDEFIKKLSAANPNMETLLKQILSDDALKEMANPTFGVFPSKPVKVGESWEGKPGKLDLGPIGQYNNTYKYTYEGKDKEKPKLDRVKIEATVKYQPPSETTASGGLPFKIKSATLASKKSGGYLLFDPEKGRVEKSSMGVELSGDLGIEIGGTTTTVNLTQTQDTTVNTEDTNPSAKKPEKPNEKPAEKPAEKPK